jgi:hypothetical protein
VLVEELQKPAVVVVTEEFVSIATQIARLRGHAGLRQMVLPYPLEGLAEQDVRTIAREAYPRLIRCLTGSG